MKYRNIKNGAVIDVPCAINDSGWELITPGLPIVEEKLETKQEAPKQSIKVEEIKPSTKKNAVKTAIIHPRKKKEG